MIVPLKILLTTIILTIAVSANGQTSDSLIRQKVLHRAIIGRTFVFGKWTPTKGFETHLTYLGKVNSQNGQTYKIVNSVWHWGLSHRATSRILVFSNNNKYIGNYYVTVTSDLPTKLIEGKLIFENRGGDCDRKIRTIVDLTHGLPNSFFRKCKGEYGDIYSFDSTS